MTEIGGNAVLTLQTKTSAKNGIGEGVKSWKSAASLTGFLDLMTGTSTYSTFNAKMQESTHIFIADYAELNVEPEDCRALIGGQVYDVLLIDDPMGLHEHLEIYLKFVGSQKGGMG